MNTKLDPYTRISIFAIVLITLAAILALAGCGAEGATPNPQPQQQVTVEDDEVVDLIGKWRGGDDGLVFDATINDKMIDIFIILEGDDKALYWTGTFDPNLEDGDVYESKGDTDAMDGSLMGSGDDVKNFQYTDGQLDFDFTMVGVTRTVHLQRE